MINLDTLAIKANLVAIRNLLKFLKTFFYSSYSMTLSTSNASDLMVRTFLLFSI